MEPEEELLSLPSGTRLLYRLSNDPVCIIKEGYIKEFSPSGDYVSIGLFPDHRWLETKSVVILEVLKKEEVIEGKQK